MYFSFFANASSIFGRYTNNPVGRGGAGLRGQRGRLCPVQPFSFESRECVISSKNEIQIH